MSNWTYRCAVIGAIAALSSPSFAADRTGITKDSIKIGIFGPVTSSNTNPSVWQKLLNGVIAVYKDVNEKGGIHGRKLELVVEDDRCDPKASQPVLKKLVEEQKVFALHGAYCSTVALAVKPEVAKTPTLPWMVLGAGSVDISTPVTANIFHPVPTSVTVGNTIVDFALSKPGAKKIGIIVQNPDDGPLSQYRAAVARLKKLNIEPVEIIHIDRGRTDFTEQVKKFQEKKPDFILGIMYPPEFAAYLRDAYRLNFHVPTVTVQGTSLDDTDKRLGIPQALKDVYFFYPLNDLLTAPKMRKYSQLLKKHYPADALDTLSYSGMGGALAIVEALKQSGPDLTREKFMAELNKLRNFDPGIQAGPITFTPSDHAGIKSGKMLTLVKTKPVILSKYPSAAR
jgi:branched-chain amino acid transport system substrate-binding protein